MLEIKKESGWKFVMSSSAGAGVEFVAAEGGCIYMQDPSGAPITFHYGAAGAGLSAGLKLPKVGKLQIKGKSVGGAVAPAAFPNAGKLYMLDTFQGSELSRSDITGVCMFAEIGGGLVVGGSATAMLVGMDPIWLLGFAEFPVMPLAEFEMLRTATGVLFMGGVNAGLNAGGGGAVFLGGLV